MAITKLENLINPEVMGDMIDAKITAMLKLTPYAKLELGCNCIVSCAVCTSTG